MKTRDFNASKAGLKAFSSDPDLSALVQRRVAKMKARNERNGKGLLREARDLRVKLMQAARASSQP
jgi:hypothetical protein